MLVSKLEYDEFDTSTSNIFDLCMNYIRDDAFELYDAGYNVNPLSELIDYFEYDLYWTYDNRLDGYSLMNVKTGDMSEVDKMHELATAYKCLNTLYGAGIINSKQYKPVKKLYERAYDDCIKVLCGGWKRGEPESTYELTPYNVLCDEQKIINEGDKTYLVSIFS